MKNNIIKWSDLQVPKLESINLELTGYCNYRCNFCMNPQDDFRKKGHMDDTLVSKIIKELDNSVKIHVCGVGEPSLHPDFIQIMTRLIDKFDFVSLVTNGALFTKYSADEINKLGIAKINFSLDYIDSNKYKKEKGGNLEDILDSIQLYSNKQTSKTLLQINYLYQDTHSKDEIITTHERLSKMLKDKWVLYIRVIKDLAGQMDIQTNEDEDELDQIFQNNISDTFVVENWNRYLKDTNFKEENPKICRHIYKYYMLLWNGDIVPCCQDFNAQLKLFNVLNKKYNLQEVFNTSEYLTFLKIWKI